MNTQLPKSVLNLFKKGGEAEFTRQDDGSFICDSPSGNGHAVKGGSPVPAPLCDCKGFEIHAHCSHNDILTELQTMCLPGETLTRGRVRLCPDCADLEFRASCCPQGAANITRVKCGCLQGETRVK